MSALEDLAERLTEKADVLKTMSKEHDLDHHERIRLQGKSEGVRLALSFVEEAVRAAR
jgi:hypothetical protein